MIDTPQPYASAPNFERSESRVVRAINRILDTFFSRSTKPCELFCLDAPSQLFIGANGPHRVSTTHKHKKDSAATVLQTENLRATELRRSELATKVRAFILLLKPGKYTMRTLSCACRHLIPYYQFCSNLGCIELPGTCRLHFRRQID